MTLNDYQTATGLLDNIEKLEEAKIRAEQSIVVEAQAQSMNDYVDIVLLQESIIDAIDAKILIDTNAFAAL